MKHEIVAFSDVHLGQKNLQDLSLWENLHLGKDGHTDKKAFECFVKALSENPPSKLVILGDFLDFWRRTNNQILSENKKVLTDLFSLPSEIYYVVGNHDYLIWNLWQHYNKEHYNKGGKVKFSKDLRLNSGGKQIYFTHGYDLDVQVTMEVLGIEWYESYSALQCRADNSLGGIASRLWTILTTLVTKIRNIRKIGQHPHTEEDLNKIDKIARSGIAHLFCGAQPGDMLVFGHTHRAFINENKSVINTGCWSEDTDSRCGKKVSWCSDIKPCSGNPENCWGKGANSWYKNIDSLCNGKGIYITNTYVTIDQGSMELKHFTPQSDL